MPTYEYRCNSCDTVTEAVQGFTDAPLSDCPSCGETSLRKLFGNVGVVFKGSGFYRNDARAERSKARDSGSSDADGSRKTETPAPAASGSSDAPAKVPAKKEPAGAAKPAAAPA